MSLIATFDGPEAFDRIRGDAALWEPAMRELCRRHDLPAPALRTFARASNVVFDTGAGVVLKLFPPFHRGQFESEVLVTDRFHGRLALATPRILGRGELEGWPYLLVSRLPGATLDTVWAGLDPSTRREVMTAIGRPMADAHRLPVDGLEAVDLDWDRFVAAQTAGCVARQRRTGLPERLVREVPGFLASAPIPRCARPVLLTGEYTPFNLMFDEGALSGMIDFGDCCLGHPEYDLLGPALFLAAGDAALVRALFGAYGYADAELTDALRRRQLALALLHRYSDLPAQIAVPGWQGRVASLEELARLLWPFEPYRT